MRIQQRNSTEAEADQSLRQTRGDSTVARRVEVVESDGRFHPSPAGPLSGSMRGGLRSSPGPLGVPRIRAVLVVSVVALGGVEDQQDNEADQGNEPDESPPAAPAHAVQSTHGDGHGGQQDRYSVQTEEQAAAEAVIGVEDRVRDGNDDGKDRVESTNNQYSFRLAPPPRTATA